MTPPKQLLDTTPESVIQTKIIKHLTNKGYLVLKIIQSNKNGWVDLEAMKDGKTTYIEVKVPGRALEPLQKYRKRQIEAHGFTHVTAWGVSDVEHLK